MRRVSVNACSRAYRLAVVPDVQGFGLKAHWLVVKAGVELPATVPIAVLGGAA